MKWNNFSSLEIVRNFFYNKYMKYIIHTKRWVNIFLLRGSRIRDLLVFQKRMKKKTKREQSRCWRKTRILTNNKRYENKHRLKKHTEKTGYILLNKYCLFYFQNNFFRSFSVYNVLNASTVAKLRFICILYIIIIIFPYITNINAFMSTMEPHPKQKIIYFILMGINFW